MISYVIITNMIEAAPIKPAVDVIDVPLERKRLGEWMFGDVIGNGSSGKVRFCSREKNPSEKVNFPRPFMNKND